MTSTSPFPSYTIADEAQVFSFSLNTPADDRTLSDDERARAARLIRPEVRRRFVVGRAQLRAILGHCIGVAPDEIAFAYGEHGKPMLPGNPIHFNLTHSGDHALLAVALRPVGIDLEAVQPSPNLAQMADMTFHPDEATAWNTWAHERKLLAFTRTWARKEAVVKAMGAGLGASKTFCIPITDAEQTIRLADWTIYDLPAEPGFVAALAVARETRGEASRHFDSEGQIDSNSYADADSESPFTPVANACTSRSPAE